MTKRSPYRRGWLALSTAIVAGALAATVTPPAHSEPPGNDDIEDAVVVPGAPFTETRDTSEATLAGGDSGCGASTVWYTFTPETDGAYEFDTIGSDYDTTLALFEGSPGDLTLLACNDDAVGLQSVIRHELTAATTYYVEAGTCCGGDAGQVGPGGFLVFNVDDAPPVLDIELALAPRGTIGPERSTATVSGTVTCNNQAYVYIAGSLRQRQGLNIVRGDFYTETACTSTPTTWSATVDAVSRFLLPSPATLTGYTSGCDGFTCDEDSDTRTIKLRR